MKLEAAVVWLRKIKKQVPLRKSEVKPFHESADRITAGQNGATFWDQSAALMSCKCNRY